MKRGLALWLICLAKATADGAPSELPTQGIALNCLSCHQQAATQQAVPVLSDLSNQHLRQSLLDFKNGKRSGTLMPRLVKGFSDEQLLAVADYLITP